MTTGRAFDFAGLYREHAPHVFRYALYLSGDRATAEDVVSETFVRVWGARERVELSTVRAYLLAIARNVFLQGLRRRRREAPLDDATLAAARAPEHDPLAARELAWMLARLAELPEVDRTALLLRAEAELPYEDIAHILGLSPVAVRVKVHRARARLARLRKETP